MIALPTRSGRDVDDVAPVGWDGEVVPEDHDRWTPRLDAVTALTVFVVLVYALPARLVFRPIGAAGRPAALLALGLIAWWVAARMVPGLAVRGRQPVRTAALAYGWVVLLTYAVAISRELPGVQARAADRSLLVLAGLLGVLLVAADGIPSRDRLDTILRRVVYAATALALLGHLQFFAGVNLAVKIRLPGLGLNRELATGIRRAAFERVSGTATHPIEFGVVLAMVLPLAIHYALYPGEDRPRRWWRWLIVGILGVGSLLAVSRSAVLVLLAGMLVLGSVWSWRKRGRALVVGAVALVALRFVSPGLIGTLRGLFVNYDTDGSVQVRVNDYETVFAFIRERPWFGLGPGTFLPSEYLQLDNQVLKTILETGYVGFAALVVLVVVGLAMAGRTWRLSPDPAVRHLACALFAMILGAFVTCFTFDAFTYAILTGMLFLSLGCAGALWRLEVADRPGAGP